VRVTNMSFNNAAPPANGYTNGNVNRFVTDNRG